jgi:hypothetical protein
VIIDKKSTETCRDKQEQTNKPMMTAFVGLLRMQWFTADVTDIGCNRIISFTPGALYDVIVQGRTPQYFGSKAI